MNDLIPIRGNALGLAGECDRLKTLADRLESVGETIRLVRTTTWEGPARDRYDEVQSAIALNWLRVADSHRQAAIALTGYRGTLEYLQTLSNSQLAEVRESGYHPEAVAIARTNLDRWHLQLDGEGRRAAEAIRKANLELVSLRRALGVVPQQRSEQPQERTPEPDKATTSEPTPEQETPSPQTPTESPSPSPALAFVDNDEYRRLLRDLNAAVLDAVQR